MKKTNQLMNVIFGTDDGNFTLHFAWNASRTRKTKNYKFPADQPEKCLPILQAMVKLHGKINCVLTSSSMDFPHEENVTEKQVKALWKAIEVKA